MIDDFTSFGAAMACVIVALMQFHDFIKPGRSKGKRAVDAIACVGWLLIAYRMFVEAFK